VALHMELLIVSHNVSVIKKAPRREPFLLLIF
jgi:hypothetical protein